MINMTRKRQGMTLMEIMISVMVLGLGLLGILSVIPFIEYHSGRVIESDFVAATGKNAFVQIAANHWEHPSKWGDVHSNILVQDDTGNTVAVSGYFVTPYFFDVFGKRAIYEDRPEEILIPAVYPDSEVYTDQLRNHDDIVYDRDENPQNRPELLFDETGDTGNPEFTGAYSWAALMSLAASDSRASYRNLTVPTRRTGNFNGSLGGFSMKVDVMVFRNRVPQDSYDYIVEPVNKFDGGGYAGGGITVSCGNSTPKEFENSLNSSTHILLIGRSDTELRDTLNPVPYHSAWYKIANYRKVGNDFRVTLFGANTPKCWVLDPAHVRVVLFRNLRGVFTQTLPIGSLSDDE